MWPGMACRAWMHQGKSVQGPDVLLCIYRQQASRTSLRPTDRLCGWVGRPTNQPTLGGRSSLRGQRGLLHGLRMAARLFRLGRILCTPPRRVCSELRYVQGLSLGAVPSFNGAVPLLLLGCNLFDRCCHSLGRYVWPTRDQTSALRLCAGRERASR